jgi:hypothetical protein
MNFIYLSNIFFSYLVIFNNHEKHCIIVSLHINKLSHSQEHYRQIIWNL